MTDIVKICTEDSALSLQTRCFHSERDVDWLPPALPGVKPTTWAYALMGTQAGNLFGARMVLNQGSPTGADQMVGSVQDRVSVLAHCGVPHICGLQ